jgi:hypothetical protein
LLAFDPHLTLITGAFDGEIDLLRNHPKFPHVNPMGIGNLEQAIQTFAYLVKNPQIQQIVFLGSCGVYSWNEIKRNTIVSPNAVYSKELITALGLGKQLPMDPPFYPLHNDPMFSDGICNAPSSITLQTMETPPLKSWQAFAFENLELFGLAKVADQFHIPITAYLVVTNGVGPNGSFEWQTHWRESSNQLQNLFLL